jgi:ribosomal protein S27AE
MMVITKGCPRCSGDLAFVSDIDDVYYSCVQCGFVQYPDASGAPQPLRPVIAEQPRPVALSRDEVHRRVLRRRLAERQQKTSAA